MKVVLFTSSWDAVGNREVELDLAAAVQVSEFLDRLEEKAAFIKPYIHRKGGKITGFRLALLRGEEILGLSDWIHAEDTIKVLPPIVGG